MTKDWFNGYTNNPSMTYIGLKCSCIQIKPYILYLDTIEYISAKVV